MRQRALASTLNKLGEAEAVGMRQKQVSDIQKNPQRALNVTEVTKIAKDLIPNENTKREFIANQGNLNLVWYTPLEVDRWNLKTFFPKKVPGDKVLITIPEARKIGMSAVEIVQNKYFRDINDFEVQKVLKEAKSDIEEYKKTLPERAKKIVNDAFSVETITQFKNKSDLQVWLGRFSDESTLQDAIMNDSRVQKLAQELK